MIYLQMLSTKTQWSYQQNQLFARTLIFCTVIWFEMSVYFCCLTFSCLMKNTSKSLSLYWRTACQVNECINGNKSRACQFLGALIITLIMMLFKLFKGILDIAIHQFHLRFQPCVLIEWYIFWHSRIPITFPFHLVLICLSWKKN